MTKYKQIEVDQDRNLQAGLEKLRAWVSTNDCLADQIISVLTRRELLVGLLAALDEIGSSNYDKRSTPKKVLFQHSRILTEKA